MTSACNRVQPELAAYNAGWLDPARRREVEEHLASCRSCAAAAAVDRRVVEGLEAMPAVAPTPIAWEQALARHEAGRKPRPGSGRPAAAALAVAAAALALFLLPRGASGPGGPADGPAAAVAEQTDVSCLVQAHNTWSVGAMAGDPNRAVLLSAAHREPGGHAW